jgi:hypothetical protein
MHLARWLRRYWAYRFYQVSKRLVIQKLEKTLNEYFSIKRPPTAEEFKKAKVILEIEKNIYKIASDSLENQFQVGHTVQIEAAKN